MKRLIVSLPEEIHKELKHYCVDQETQMAEVVRRLIEEFLRKAKTKK
jgi:metal-responsive CopG/Arc/MetJ family transcriptional regulator